VAEVLSQQEIDKLLSGINSGAIEEEQLSSIGKDREIQDYDFRRPTRVSKDQLKTIRTLHESFAEIFGFYLASKLQTMVTIDLLAVDQLRYSEYVLSISNPSCVYIIDIKETEGRAVLELTPELVFTSVERLLGGSGTAPVQPRPITRIEQKIMEPVVKQALDRLAAAWKPIYELSFSLAGFESNPDFVQIAPASEIVIVISFEIKIRDESFMMNLCYPSFSLEDVIARLNAQFFAMGSSRKDKDKSTRKIKTHLGRTKMEVRAILGTAKITLKELLDLEEGDVLRLDTQLEDDVKVLVGNREKFYGRPGLIEDRMSIKITEVLPEE